MARMINDELKTKKIVRTDDEQRIIINDDCTKCGLCVEECPVDAISEGEYKMTVDDKKCILCKWCIDVCPVEQISLEELPMNNFMAKMKKKFWYSNEYPEIS